METPQGSQAPRKHHLVKASTCSSPQAFLSYAHIDDEFLGGRISFLRDQLERAIRVFSGRSFQIFQDKDGIAFGQHWPKRLEEALAQARFLIPILSPSWFNSRFCRDEAQKFLQYERMSDRLDLILPVYLIESEVLEDGEKCNLDPVAKALSQRQYRDWREFIFDDPEAKPFKAEVVRLARDIAAVAKRESVRRVRSEHTALLSDRATEVCPEEIEEVVEREFQLLEAVKVRCEAHAGARAACRLDRGALLYVAGRVRSQNWYRVELDTGENGYVYARDLSEIVARVVRAGNNHSTSEEALAPGTIVRDGNVSWCPEMITVPPGPFVMGAGEDEAETQDSEKPRHEVYIQASFALGRYPVTFAQYDAFCAATGRQRLGDAGWGRGRRPVINVSWQSAQDYCAWLSDRTNKRYRLPSEAEWEFACRAGNTARYWWGDFWSEDGGNVANGSSEATTEVDAYQPNPWGLFDMHGNIWEWCADAWHADYNNAPANGSAWTTGGVQGCFSLRGGAWNTTQDRARASSRVAGGAMGCSAAIGFRVCRHIDL